VCGCHRPRRYPDADGSHFCFAYGRLWPDQGEAEEWWKDDERFGDLASPIAARRPASWPIFIQQEVDARSPGYLG
jgi:hypothetical protein